MQITGDAASIVSRFRHITVNPVVKNLNAGSTGIFPDGNPAFDDQNVLRSRMFRIFLRSSEDLTGLARKFHSSSAIPRPMTISLV